MLRLGLRSGGTDYGQGTNTGAGKWIGPLPTATDLASGQLPLQPAFESDVAGLAGGL